MAENNMVLVLSQIKAKATVKDSIFRDLFSDKKYDLQIYQALHPDDKGATEDDIDHVTIDNVITNQMYNDLGMTVRGMLLILLEAQSTWTVNIIIRILLYLAHTWQRYIEETKQNQYGSKKLAVPRPEFYVIYTGDRKDGPEWITLSEEFFDGNADFLEVKVRVLYGKEGQKDIISQYVDFTKVYNSQVKLYGRTEKAILETIRICRDRDILKEYLESREKEVISIMKSLFDQEKIMEQYIGELMEEYGGERERRGEQLGEKKERRKNIQSMSKFLSIEKIAEILQIPVEEVRFSLES